MSSGVDMSTAASWTLDPAVVSLNDVFYHCFSFLDHAHLTRCACVSSEWKGIACSDSLWVDLCDRLWSDKVHVSQEFKNMKEKQSAREAFKLSVIDSKRQYVTLEELTTLSWRFRFKQRAGPGWTDDDPYWNNEEPLRRRFLPDGRMKFDFRCADEIDAAAATSYARFGQTEAEPRVERVARMGENYMSMFHEEDEDENEDKQQAAGANMDDEDDDVSQLRYARGDDSASSSSTRRRVEMMQRTMNFRWEFTNVSLRPNTPRGSAIRVNNFPSYHVSRHKGNWGFIMQSVWVFMASFDLPRQGEDPECDDNHLQPSQMTEMVAYNWGVPVHFMLDLARAGGIRELIDDSDDEVDF